MSDSFFKVFKHHTHTKSWDKQIEYIRIQEGLADNLREKALEAYTFLRNELEEHFLKHQYYKNHPIHFHLLNKAEYSYEWIIELSRILRFLKGRPCNYEKLLDKLRQADKCETEGVPFVDIAISLVNVGLDVVFEPNINSKQKNADIEVTNPENGDRFYIEISKYDNNKERAKTSNNYHTLFHKFHLQLPILPFSCKLIGYIDDKEMEKTLGLIQELKSKALSEETFVSFENSNIEFAVAHHTQIKQLEEWCELKGKRSMDVEGLPLDFDDTKKIRDNKIPQKAKQIPKNYCGLIYIYVDPLYFWATDPNTVVEQLQSRLEQFPKVFGVVLYSYQGTQVENHTSSANRSFYSQKMMNQSTMRYLLFACNLKCKTGLKSETITKIYKSFQ